MITSEIRKKYLDFFQKNLHDIQASAPIVNKDDPTLMFVNAGMNQFKDIFLGNQPAKHPRVANSQKCLRVSGKHNDLEEVGVDTYHHTLFEMLGNWSFGDYFKDQAVSLAWKFITEELGISKDQLYVTYFEGDQADGIAEDLETKDLWKQFLPEERILKGNKKDNFWEMGDVGPCGPCTEIHVDIRNADEKEKVSGRDLVNQDHPQVIEIWNLVFIQYNRFANGSLKALPQQHVDTGMGLERLAMVMQGKQSTYDTDIFAALIQHLESKSGKKYTGADSKEDIAFRVIADHIRAVAFAIGDGQLPSNTGAGYVIRRILRRAIRYGYSFLGFTDSFMFGLVPSLVHLMGDYFSEIKAQEKFIVKVVREEEASFFRTLASGLNILDGYTQNAKQGELPGEKAFELYDTFGFPFDLTRLILSERGWTTSEKDFNACMEQQKSRSKQAAKQDVDDWVFITEDVAETTFVGYDQLSAEVKVARYRKVTDKKGTFYHVVLDTTPFYPEGGGQVGDVGYLEFDNKKYSVLNTKKENLLVLHILKELPSSFEGTAVVNAQKRNSTKRNHTATHLLHHVLRDKLGTHVEQRGSLVSPDYLRFDFSHFEKVDDNTLREVEDSVNQWVLNNIALEEFRSIPIAQAQEMGAMALFGEKYGEQVRAIKFGASVELCGGTHVNSTGEIGFCKIVSESSVAAGVRRIEMLTGEAAFNWANDKALTLAKVEELLGSKKDVVADLDKLLQQKNALQKELEEIQQKELLSLTKELKTKAVTLENGLNFISYHGQLPANAVKDLAYGLKDQEDTAVVIASNVDGKALLQVALNKSLVSKGLNAKALIKETSSLIQGGGGGQDFLASAGGKNPDGLPEAIERVRQIVGSH